MSHAVGLSTYEAIALIALVVALCSTGDTWSATLGVAVIGWLFVTGLVINSRGESPGPQRPEGGCLGGRGFRSGEPAFRPPAFRFKELIDRLSGPGPIPVQGIAIVRNLLTDGAGPIYRPGWAEELRGRPHAGAEE